MKWVNIKRNAALAALLTGALLLAAVPVPAFGAPEAAPGGQSGQNEQAGHDWKDDRGHWREHHEARKLKHLKEAAEYFGIATEGKTADQLRTELKAAKEKDAAKWERFKAEHKAKRLERLQTIARKLGISTEGKSAKQLREEIRAVCREKRNAAKRDGKSGEETKQDQRSGKKAEQSAGGSGSHM
ncbi:hypothetical protein [Paenibacillus humicola]|uniref:hypothetical protein n=1 Tax=Paenibacillus humicola TaxID=3110540 RepID=UPI00237AB130|nr:hypothetical protein [Paenibacillus humicola]